MKKKNLQKRKNKSVARKKKQFRLKDLFLVLCVLIFLYAGFVFFQRTQKYTHAFSLKSTELSSITGTSLLVSTPTSTPSVTLTPNPTASPTPVVPSGFCLTVPVLMYHHVEPMQTAKAAGHAQLTVDVDYFEQHMKYLNDHGYTSYFAQDLADALINHQSLPGKPVVVTIDDGYDDFFSYGYPIVKKYNIKTSLFISTGLLQVSGYMNWDNIKDMEGSGFVSSYNHTWSHYSLGKSDRAKAEQEIITAKMQLEARLGKADNIFAYPYGNSSQTAADVLQKNGFKAAFTTLPSFYQCDSYLMYLRRNRIGNAPLSSFGI